MLDVNIIRANPEQLKENIKRRHLKGEFFDVDRFLDIDKQRVALISQVEVLRAERNKLSDVQGKPSPDVIAKGKELKDQIKELDEKIDEVESVWQTFMDWFPNIPHSEMPDGTDSTSNRQVKSCGQLSKFSFDARPHVDIGEALNLIDVKKSGDIAGSRFFFLKNEAVMMQWGIFSITIEKLRSRGFQMMIPPVILKYRPLYGTGYFPSEESQVYELKQGDGIEDEERHFLAGTSEQALVSYHMDEILDERDLPVKYGGISTCFRSEAGSWGKDVRGIKRVHQFDKVEMIYFTTPESSQQWMQEALEVEEEVLRDLGLTYRVLEMCTGDVGLATHRKFDVEVWLPSQQDWMETHSNSDLASFHTRRLNTRFRRKDGTLDYPHTISATAITNTRPIAAILDVYQCEDGSVVVPEVLRKYLGKDVIRKED